MDFWKLLPFLLLLLLAIGVILDRFLSHHVGCGRDTQDCLPGRSGE